MNDRILVVDDCEPVRTVVAQSLSLAGYSVAMAGEGSSAVREILAACPALVVLDVGMRGLSGWDILRWMRQDRERARAPVIMMSGRADAGSKALSWRLGCTWYLTKPFSCEELILVVSKVLATSAAELSC